MSISTVVFLPRRRLILRSKFISRKISYLVSIAPKRVTAVVVENVERPRGHMIRVDALDGQVMNRRGLRPGLHRGDLYPGTRGGLQPHARRQVDRVDPQPQVRHPERVLIGRDHHIPGRHRTRDTRVLSEPFSS